MIDLELVARAVWRRRWLVVLVMVVGALAGVGLSMLGTRYVSRGLLLTPDLSVGDYKRWEEALLNKPRLERMLEANGKQDDPVADLMRDLTSEPAQLQQGVKPKFAFTDRDAKQFGVKADDQAGQMVGIELSVKQKHAGEEAPVLLLAEYIRDTAISVDLESIILRACLENEVREQELRNDKLESDFQIAQLEARAARLGEIVKRMPEGAGLDARQVVSIENGGDRFLPPATQLASTEVAIADRRLDDVRRERERIGAEIRRDYYCEARKLIDGGMSGRDLLSSLPGLQQQAMAGRDLSVNAIEQAANTLELESRRWVNRYNAQMRFVVPPQGAHTIERRPGRATGAVLGGALGGLFGVLLAIALGWWRQHREGIVSDDP